MVCFWQQLLGGFLCMEATCDSCKQLANTTEYEWLHVVSVDKDTLSLEVSRDGRTANASSLIM